MGNIFVTSDTHFNHENFLKFTDENGNKIRPFSDVNEMNEVMIERWNSVVKPGDKIYHLGDVYFGSQQKAIEIMKRLNGQKRLIVGNHDNVKDTVLHIYFEKIYMWRVWKDKKMVFSHVPMHPSNLTIGTGEKPDSGRWEDREKSLMLNVHGHIHQNDSPDGPYRNVSVERTDYYPLSIEEM